MTIIEISNNQLVNTVNFLQGLSLDAAPSRSRTKLVNLIEEGRKSYAADLNELITQYQELDDHGNPATLENGNAKIDRNKAAKFSEEAAALGEEVVTIDGGLHKRAITVMGDILKNLTMKLSDTNATAYDILMDAFDNLEEEPTEDKED